MFFADYIAVLESGIIIQGFKRVILNWTAVLLVKMSGSFAHQTLSSSERPVDALKWLSSCSKYFNALFVFPDTK